MNERTPADDEQAVAPTPEQETDQVPDGEIDLSAVDLDPGHHTQELLEEHVPLTLLVDLLAPTGDTSRELLEAEGLPEETWWDEESEGDDATDGGDTPST